MQAGGSSLSDGSRSREQLEAEVSCTASLLHVVAVVGSFTSVCACMHTYTHTHTHTDTHTHTHTHTE